MFGENPSDSGSFDIEGTGIQYVKDGGNVELTITDEDGSTTVITVPIGDFGI
jgi:outer membrane usher protein FimD/PapC